MIIVKVWGGIGNQLFQYVFGEYLKYKYGQEVRYDDNSYKTTDKLRKRELDAIDADIVYDNRCSFSKFRGICRDIGVVHLTLNLNISLLGKSKFIKHLLLSPFFKF